MKAHSVALGFFLVLMSVPLYADSPAFLPPHEEICDANDVIDKDRLAAVLMQKYPVSALAVSTCGATVAPATPSLLLARMLDPAVIKKCSPEDAAYLRSIRGSMVNLLGTTMNASFAPPLEAVPPEKYFATPNSVNAIKCVRDDRGKFVDLPGDRFKPSSKDDSNFRIRGTVAHLAIDRSQEAFETADRATVSLHENDIAGSRSSKVTGYVGYLLPFKPAQSGERVEVLPYVGIHRDAVTVDAGATAQPSAASTTSVGVLTSLFLLTGGIPSMGHVVSVRPDFLWDHEVESSIASLNLEYLPVLNRYLNASIPIRGTPFSITPMLSLKATAGFYMDRGDPSVEANNKDFLRVGPTIGLGLVMNHPIPLDLTTSYTKLAAITGDTKINYRKSTLNYSFDAKKFVGLGVSYSSGIREDTGNPEDKWEVGLTVRY